MKIIYCNLIQFKDTDFIKVISGVHRSGKSVLLMQYRDYLQQQGIPSEHILYLNFESFEYQWVKDTHILKSVILFLADNVGQLVNPSKISNTLTSERVSTSNHTISKYLDLLENAFLFYKAKQYDIRGKAYLKTNAKYFIVDNGLRRHAIGKKGANYANRLENIVFIELLRRGYTVDVGKLDSKEIDFIARKADEILYVQVAFEIPENTHETDNLLHIKDNYKKILITGKYYEQKEIDGIEVIYVVDWLLQ